MLSLQALLTEVCHALPESASIIISEILPRNDGKVEPKATVRVNRWLKTLDRDNSTTFIPRRIRVYRAYVGILHGSCSPNIHTFCNFFFIYHCHKVQLALERRSKQSNFQNFLKIILFIQSNFRITHTVISIRTSYAILRVITV